MSKKLILGQKFQKMSKKSILVQNVESVYFYLKVSKKLKFGQKCGNKAEFWSKMSIFGQICRQNGFLFKMSKNRYLVKNVEKVDFRSKMSKKSIFSQKCRKGRFLFKNDEKVDFW